MIAVLLVLAAFSVDAQKRRAVTPSGLATPPLCGDEPGWEYVEGDHARVWYAGNDRELALRLLGQIEDVWPKVAAFIGANPLRDDGPEWPCGMWAPRREPVGRHGHGGDGHFDFYLKALGQSDHGTTYVYPAERCERIPAYIDLSRDVKDVARILPHELAHACQLAHEWAFPGCLKPPDNETPTNHLEWWAEGTANAAESIFASWSDATHSQARQYLSATSRPIDDPSIGAYGYSMYPFVLFLEHKVPGSIAAIWKQLRTTTHLLDAIDIVLKPQQGLNAVWHEFARTLWNHEVWKPTPKELDGLNDRADAIKKHVELAGKPDLVYDFPEASFARLSATFYRFTFADDVRSVAFTNPFAEGDYKTIEVHALVKVEGQNARAENWTHEKKKFFCRDKKDERIEEVVVVISNSAFDASAPIVPPQAPRVMATNLGCWQYKGESTFKGHSERPTLSGGTERLDVTATGTVTMERIPSDDGVDSYRLVSGTLNWQYKFVARNCNEEVSGSQEITSESPLLAINNWFPDDPEYRRYDGADTEKVTRSICGAPPREIPFPWFDVTPEWVPQEKQLAGQDGTLDSSLTLAWGPPGNSGSYNIKWRFVPVRE